MKREVGVMGATMTLVGLVIGISIFILPGTLAAKTGPGVIVSYALASFLTVFVCVVSAQIGSLFPVSGASFIAVGRLVSPFFGFATVWMMFGGACVAIALLGYGFADYLRQMFPHVSRAGAAYGVVIALAVLNVVGMKINVIGQTLMVVVFALALVVFTLAGVTHLHVDYLVPFAPNGWWPVLAAAIPAFFSYAGFMVIIDIGGEIKNPARTIPRALSLSFIAVLATYLLVSLAVVGTIRWQELGTIAAPVGEAASRLLPGWIAVTIAAAAIAAGATSINGLLLGYSRDVLALANVKVFPAPLARTSASQGTPVNAVIFLTVLSLLALSLGEGVTQLATIIAIALLILQIFLGIAVLRAPAQLGAEFDAAPLALRRSTLWFFGGGLILISLIFLAIAIVDSPSSVLYAGAHLLAGCVYYVVRGRQLARQGITVEDEIRRQIEASRQSG
jgi:APA family basic amino acid/polyamine antiporter